MDVVTKQLLAHGIGALEAGFYSDAVDYFYDVIEYNDEAWEAHSLLGVAFCRMENFAGARHQFTFVAEHCPDHEQRRKAMLALKEAIYKDDGRERPISVSISPYERSWVTQRSA